MLLTNIYLLFIYILFIYVLVLAAVAVALFVALIVTIKKLDKIISQKKDGKYIVFLPQHSTADGLTEIQYFEKQEEKQVLKKLRLCK